ncbi:unknown [Staphylococcus sp. CAG:324]|nr:unknown [Staphylococcus sp. CAG:324]
MNSRKTLLREQKILEFIDDKVVTSRLNYPNIRDRINFSIGEKELVKNKLFYKIVVRLSFSLSVVMICIMAFFTMITHRSGIYASAQTNPILTDFVTMKELPSGNPLISNYRLNIYDFVFDNNEYAYKGKNLFEIELPPMDDGKYYCAYVSKKIMNYINSYLDIEFNVYKNTYSYKKMYLSILIHDIDDLLTKYNYYCITKNIDMNEGEYALKWSIFDKMDDIKTEIKGDQLVFIMNIRDIDNIKRLSSNQMEGLNFSCVTELRPEINNDKLNFKEEYCFKNKYLSRINYLSPDIQSYMFYDVLYRRSLSINELYGTEYIEGTIPNRYLRHFEQYHKDGSICEHSNFKSYYEAIQLLEPYKICEEQVLDEFGNIEIKIAYDYNGVKQLLQN